MSQTEVQQVEISIARAKKMIEKGEALLRLYNNDDFKLIIENGYFRDEASRLALLSASPNINEVGGKESCIGSILAIGELSQYLQAVRMMANMATETLNADKLTLDELNSGV